MKAADFCMAAANLVSGDRNRKHGNIRDNFENIADLWSAWLNIDLDATDVAAMMVLLKLARTKTGEVNSDDATDASGYAGCLGELLGSD
jgi:hypothetical protein